jgi:hypothetical protein
MKHRLKDANILKQENLKYECLACAAKAKPKKQVDPTVNANNKRSRPKPPDDDPYQYDKQLYKKKTVRQIANEEKNEVYQNSNEHYVNVFGLVRDALPNLDLFMGSLGTFDENLGLGIPIVDELIREDLVRFRQNIIDRETEEAEDENGDKKLKRRKK